MAKVLPRILQSNLIARRLKEDEMATITRAIRDYFLHYRQRKLLTKRAYEIMKMLYVERMTLDEVANFYGVTRTRILEQEKQILGRCADYDRRML